MALSYRAQQLSPTLSHHQVGTAHTPDATDVLSRPKILAFVSFENGRRYVSLSGYLPPVDPSERITVREWEWGTSGRERTLRSFLDSPDPAHYPQAQVAPPSKNTPASSCLSVMPRYLVSTVHIYGEPEEAAETPRELFARLGGGINPATLSDNTLGGSVEWEEGEVATRCSVENEKYRREGCDRTRSYRCPF